MSAPIVTLTLNPAVDAFSEAETVQPIRKIRTRNEEHHPGGGGINAARVIRDLGGDALAIYLSGGATGTVLNDLVTAIALPHLRVPIAGHTRFNQVVFERSSGLEYRFVAEGPQVSATELSACRAALLQTPCDWLVLSGSLPPGAPDREYAEIVSLMQARGTRCILDTSGAALKAALDQGALALVKPSRGEFESLAGRPLPGTQDIGAEARALAMSGKVALVAVTLGQEGAILASADGVWQFRAPPVTGRSAVGAGDSFVGAMVLALARGWRHEDAFRYAMAAGSAAVLRHGPYLCDPADVQRLYAQIT